MSIRRLDDLNKNICFIKFNDEIWDVECSLYCNQAQELIMCAANLRDDEIHETIILKMTEQVEYLGNLH